MKLQEVVDALNVNVVDVQAWFADGYQHLTNAERRQPTVDQALFTVVIMGIGLLSFLDNRQPGETARSCLSQNKNMKPFYFFLVWIFGFFVLISFDLFMEALVFEWLQWNGTEKNDWFFILWWGLVLTWFLYGTKTLYDKLKR